MVGDGRHYLLRDREVIPCDLWEWVKELELNWRVIRQTYVGYDSLWVSTVFLGLDHNFSGEGPPLVFETMVFPRGKWGELYVRRYATMDEAELGHDVAIGFAQAYVSEWPWWRKLWAWTTMKVRNSIGSSARDRVNS